MGVTSAPLGHLLAYEVRFGSTAGHAESSGVHAYFPTVAAIVAGGLGAALLASLLVLAAARLVAVRRRPVHSTGRRWPVLNLLAILFTVQLAVFLVQECGEALLSGSTMAAPPELLVWGTLGQLPIAAIAALALSWLSVRLDAAIRLLRGAADRFQPRPEPGPRRWTPAGVYDPVRTSALGAFAKRGPPSRLLDAAVT